MVFSEYTRKKKSNIKGWLSGSNSKIYFIILLLLAVTLIFVLNTLLGMRDNNQKGERTDNNSDINSDFNSENNDNNFYDGSTVGSGETKDLQHEIIKPENMYLIKVSLSDNFAIIYKYTGSEEYSEIVKAFPVSVCSNVKPSVTKVESKNIWKHIGYSLHGHYITRFENGEYFSAVACYNQNTETLNKEQYLNLGNPSVVDGSVYMPAGYAKWIYENCAIGTKIELISELKLPDNIKLDILPGIDDISYDPTE